MVLLWCLVVVSCWWVCCRLGLVLLVSWCVFLVLFVSCFCCSCPARISMRVGVVWVLPGCVGCGVCVCVCVCRYGGIARYGRMRGYLLELVCRHGVCAVLPRCAWNRAGWGIVGRSAVRMLGHGICRYARCGLSFQFSDVRYVSLSYVNNRSVDTWGSSALNYLI